MNNTSAVEVRIHAVSPPEIVSAITGALIRVGNVRAQNRRLDALEANSSSIGRRFKCTDSRDPADGFFFVNQNDAIFSFTDQNGIVRKMTNSPDFAWDNGYKMTVWGMDGELWWAADMRTGSNYSSTHLKLYVNAIKYDKGLVSGEEYDVTVEGYW